jgi:hypothetical protein
MEKYLSRRERRRKKKERRSTLLYSGELRSVSLEETRDERRRKKKERRSRVRNQERSEIQGFRNYVTFRRPG